MSRLLIYGIIALAVLAAITATIAGIYHKGYDAGQTAVKAQWEEANRQAQAKADADRQAREQEARKSSIALQQAEGKASDYENRYKAARKAASRIPLAVCPQPENAATATVATPRGDSGPLKLQLTYSFLRQWDAAWTGPDGEPVFRDPGGSSEASAAAGSPVTLDDALDNHAENAARCSANARQLDKLTNLIKTLQNR